nr:hypothetical protein BaRGS_010740 [Batillaria attramentaria]
MVTVFEEDGTPKKFFGEGVLDFLAPTPSFQADNGEEARYESGDEVVRLDFDRDPADNVKEILRHIVVQHGASKAKKLAYLNSFVKLIYKQADRGLGVGSIEILTWSLDLCLENEIERMHAIRLIRQINSVAPDKLPRSLLFPIVAIGNDAVVYLS